MAMNYTPQQLSGGAGFSRGVRVGNWVEDIALEETKVTDFLERKSTGKLALKAAAGRYAAAMTRVPHSFSPDGCVRFGDTIILAHGDSASAVACSPNDVVEGVDRDLAVSGTSHCEPVARNTLVIAPADDGAGSPGSVLHFGQPFRLASNPSLFADPHSHVVHQTRYLASYPVSTTTARRAALSGKQQVAMTLVSEADRTLWVVRPPNMRLDGMPVRANEPVVLMHKSTNQALAMSAKFSFSNDFGTELEVWCWSCKTLGRGGVKGMEIGQAMPVSRENAFRIVAAADATAAKDERTFAASTLESVLDKIRAQAGDKAAHLAAAFCTLDADGRGALNRVDFKYALEAHGVHLTDAELAGLQHELDVDGDGGVVYSVLLQALGLAEA